MEREEKRPSAVVVVLLFSCCDGSLATARRWDWVSESRDGQRELREGNESALIFARTDLEANWTDVMDPNCSPSANFW